MSAPFVGRQHELNLLERTLAEVTAGARKAVVLAAEAGMGKSRLVAEARQRAARRFEVLEAACFELDASVPYAPLIDLLRLYISRRGTRVVPPLLLSRLVPEAASGFDDGIPQPLDPDQERHRVYRAWADLLETLAQIRPLLLIVEDVHWCDDLSLGLLRFLVRQTSSAPLALLVTYRADEEPQPALRQLLADVDRHAVPELLLGPLERDEVDILVRSLRRPDAALGSDSLEALYALTEGNPFFVEEVLKASDQQPMEALRIPRTIEDIVLKRQALLSPKALRIARIAAVIGRTFSAALLQRLSDDGDGDLLRSLAELCEARILIEQSADRFAFYHALTREAIYTRLLIREREDIHAAITAALEELVGTSAAEAYLPDLAYHAYRAHAWAKVSLYAPQMAERADALSAPHAAIEYWSQAIEAAHEQRQPVSSSMFRARAQAYELLGGFERGLADYKAAQVSARAEGNPETEWQLLLDTGFLWQSRNMQRAHELLAAALRQAQVLDEPVLVARSQNRLANCLANLNRHAEALEMHRTALRAFESLGDVQGVAETLDLMAMATFIEGDLRGASMFFEQALVACQAIGDQRGLSSILSTLALIPCSARAMDPLPGPTADVREVVRRAEESLGIARRIGWRAGEAYSACSLATCLATTGEYSRAMRTADHAVAIADEIEHHTWLAKAHSHLAQIELDLLVPERARERMERAYAEACQTGVAHFIGVSAAMLALACLEGGEPEKAERLVLSYIDCARQPESMSDAILIAVLAEIRLASGDANQAQGIIERLTAWAAAVGGPQPVPGLQKLQGQALAAVGRFDEAEHVLRAALCSVDERCAPRLAWQLHIALGDVLRKQSRRGAAEHAYASARRLIDQLAIAVDDPELRATFRRRALARLPRRRPGSAVSAARDRDGGLTSREREVAALIGMGVSNRDIASRLVMSERTVETHTGHIRDKLHLTSRLQVARWAMANDLAT
jgi:DNA-binding CsgD family transcriptional regulator